MPLTVNILEYLLEIVFVNIVRNYARVCWYVKRRGKKWWKEGEDIKKKTRNMRLLRTVEATTGTWWSSRMDAESRHARYARNVTRLFYWSENFQLNSSELWTESFRIWSHAKLNTLKKIVANVIQNMCSKQLSYAIQECHLHIVKCRTDKKYVFC